MKKVGILGKKLNMTQLPSSTRGFKPVTAIWVGGNTISQVKILEKDGYNSCQIAFGDCSKKSLNKALLGHLDKKSISPKKHLREVREMVGFEVGSQIDLSILQEGDKV